MAPARQSQSRCVPVRVLEPDQSAVAKQQNSKTAKQIAQLVVVMFFIPILLEEKALNEYVLIVLQLNTRQTFELL